MKQIRKPVTLLIILCMLLMSFSVDTFASTDSNIFLAKNAVWKYIDNGVDLGTSWRDTKFDDTAWKGGKAPLGFGDDYSETDPSLPLATKVDYGKDDNKNMTTYFRTTIDVKNLNNYSALETYIHVDDGAVIYINGIEAFRKGIDQGIDVKFDTSAKFKPKEETFRLPINLLKEGINTIAAEVHQDDNKSSDLWFEMSIKGVTGNSSEPSKEVKSAAIPDPTAPKGKITKVTVTFNGDAQTSKGFTWYTTLASADNDLQVVEKNTSKPDFEKALNYKGSYAVSTNSPKELLHKAQATGLKPNSTYYFRVGDKNLDLWSEVGSFKTAGQKGPFTFIDLADTQAKSEDEAILASKTIETALSTVKKSEFLVINGDIVDTGMNESQWDWLLGNSQKSLLHTTVLPAAGNHEEDKNSFIEHFNIAPAKNSDTITGAYYSVDYRNVHFVVLNNNEDSPEYADFTPAQINWLKEDIKAAKVRNGIEWVIVNMHKGPYTTSNHATDKDMTEANGVRTKVAPLMAELGIDLVLQGHDHIYARTKPIKAGTASKETFITEKVNGMTINYTVNPQGTIYLIPATAGPKVYYKNKDIDKSYYDLFAVADENHAAKYGADPKDKSRPLRGAIQNFIGITIDGKKLTAVSYEIDQKKADGKAYIIDQFGIIKK